MGTIPPTRPVAGGHLGINMHISEIVSDILDPIIGEHVGGCEILSTEDMIERIEILNELHRGWSKVSYWRNLIHGEYRSCMECDGTDLYVWDEDDPELCKCVEYDGIDEDGRVLITAYAMKSLRRMVWEQQVGWDATDLDKRFTVMESLPEDVQDQSQPMGVVGTDVVNLYPSLDIGKVVNIVKDAILQSGVSWEEVDYLEASRYIALNWTKEQCDGSRLRRLLPTRRYTTGSRPGRTGAGPQGAMRGDQEQWVFPSVRLQGEDKILLVATVVQLATEAMFKNHYYGFNRKQFRQREGGPIGLRGTCSIARMTMQVLDTRWEDLVRSGGVTLDLYMRYMDDGRKLLQPIRRGWRWMGNQLVFRLRWEQEDRSRTPLDMTVGLVKETINGTFDFVDFTV